MQTSCMPRLRPSATRRLTASRRMPPSEPALPSSDPDFPLPSGWLSSNSCNFVRAGLREASSQIGVQSALMLKV